MPNGDLDSLTELVWAARYLVSREHCQKVAGILLLFIKVHLALQSEGHGGIRSTEVGSLQMSFNGLQM